MKIPYWIALILFPVLYLIPVIVLWVFVHERIEERAVTLQLFLKNQADVDRQIIAKRSELTNIQPKTRTAILGQAPKGALGDTILDVKEVHEDVQKFWQRYETTYLGRERPQLRAILESTQENQLLEEEAEAVRRIRRGIDTYIAKINKFLVGEQEKGVGPTLDERVAFLEELTQNRNAIYQNMNQLADIRYIYAQRVIFSASGENERQRGVFTAIFAMLLASVFSVAVVEFFIIHRPFSDIMAFLRDLKEGKRGQRLYFSSLIREVKESEESINEFIGKAEEYEKERK